MPFTPVELATIAHAVEDYAGAWYGPQLIATFSRWDCERYVTEGYLYGKQLAGQHTMAEVWEQVREYLDTHPEILAEGRLTDAQRVERRAGRDAAAEALLNDAKEPFLGGRWDEALGLVDRAELASPEYAPRGFVPFDRYRKVIANKRDAAELSVGG